MATRISVVLEDDLDGGPAAETVRFGLGAVEYEIDLNKKNELDVAHAQLRGEVPYGDPALHGEALRWALFAQFDSDHWAGMMWGDCGTLYWLIRPSDPSSA